MSKKTGVEAIEAVELHKSLDKLNQGDMRLPFFALYVLTYQPSWYPGDWPKIPELQAIPKTMPYIERVAYVGKLMAKEWERVRDAGGFAVPKMGL